ncbi:MAG: YkgJ family cysteine cluster protein [Nitrospiria bacterium]
MEKYRSLRQIVPSSLCLTCEVCCRFPEETSFLAPYFTDEEIGFLSPLEKGDFTPIGGGSKVRLVPHGEGCICPFFDPGTHACKIYSARPLDCRIYPYALMRDKMGSVVLGVDTKCPFIQTHADEAGSRSAAGEMARFLESDPILSILTAHPALIGPYQDDVIIVRPRERLTDLIGRKISESHDC